MSWCRIRVSNTLYWTAHAHGTDRQSKACKSNPPLDPSSAGQNFQSQQVRMSGCRVLVGHTMDLTFHARGTDRRSKACKSNSPLILQEESKQKFFNHGMFECLGVALGSPIHCIGPHMHMARTGSQRLANPTLLWIQTCSAGQNFQSQQVRMSGCHVEFQDT